MEKENEIEVIDNKIQQIIITIYEEIVSIFVRLADNKFYCVPTMTEDFFVVVGMHTEEEEENSTLSKPISIDEKVYNK